MRVRPGKRHLVGSLEKNDFDGEKSAYNQVLFMVRKLV